jgi:hypothetical protein
MSESMDPGAADYPIAGCGAYEPEQIVELADALEVGAVAADHQAHLDACDACGSAVQTQLQVRALLGRAPRAQAPAGLARGIRAGMQPQPLPLASRVPGRWVAATAAAAAVLLATAMLVYLEARGPNPTGGPGSLASTRAPDTAGTARAATSPDSPPGRSAADRTPPVPNPELASRETASTASDRPRAAGTDAVAAQAPTLLREEAVAQGPEPAEAPTPALAAADSAPSREELPAAQTPAARVGAQSTPESGATSSRNDALAASDLARAPRQAAAAALAEAEPALLPPEAAGTPQPAIRVSIRALDPEAARPRVEALLREHGALVFRMVEPGGEGAGARVTPVVAHVPRAAVRPVLRAIQETDGLRLPGATYPPPPGDGAHVLLLLEVTADPIPDDASR